MRALLSLMDFRSREIGAEVVVSIGADVSTGVISKLARPLLRKMMLMCGLSRSILRIFIVSPPITDFMSSTILVFCAAYSVSPWKESRPTMLKLGIPIDTFGKFLIKLMERSSSNLTSANRLELAAFLAAVRILPLKANGRINKITNREPRTMPKRIINFFIVRIY